MPQIPLPHGLIKPTLNNGIFIGCIVTSEFNMEHLLDFKAFSGNKSIWEITDVLEERKARGDWSKWKNHPKFYRLKLRFIPESEVPKDKEVIELN